MVLVEGAVTAAEEEAAKVLGHAVQHDDEDDAGEVPQPVVPEDELMELETAVKKAKKAAGTVSQVRYETENFASTTGPHVWFIAATTICSIHVGKLPTKFIESSLAIG